MLGALGANFSQTMRNRKRRKVLEDKVGALEGRIGERSVDAIAGDILDRSKRVETRMASWAGERRELTRQVAEVASWKAQQQAAQTKLSKSLADLEGSQLTEKELQAALAGLESKLTKERDKATNVIKQALVDLKRTVTSQGEADAKNAKQVKLLEARLKQLSGQIAQLEGSLGKLRQVQAKDRQAAGTQGAKLTVQLSNLSTDVTALRKGLDRQTARAAALQKTLAALTQAVEALKKHEHAAKKEEKKDK